MKTCSQDVLEGIVQRLVAALRPTHVYLFGSHARGDADEDSDLDLLVVVPDTSESPRDLARLGRRSLWGLRIPADIFVCTVSELETWSKIQCNLIHTAVDRGRLLYAS
jgi:predicted nucleotidyltransferase